MTGAVPQSRNDSLRRRSIYAHWMQERVRWSDTDLVGHVNNLSFSAYFESGRTHFLRPVLAGGAHPPMMLLVAQMTVNFLGEVHWPADIDVGTGVLAVGRTSCRVGQALFDGDRCVSSAESVLVLIDEASRKPRQIPECLRSWLTGFAIAEADRQG